MTVRHARGTYEINFVPKESISAKIPAGAPVITDSNVANLLSGWTVDHPVFAIPAGEESKNLNQFGRALEWLAEQNVKRSDTIVALGGGVVGDLAGFVAASYMRGIPFVQVPTTLLAQVDSSVGGKVGIDLPQGKNLAGAFHAPASVLICTEVLPSLSKRQFTNGMAEVWKYGFIGDAVLVDELLEMNLDANHPGLESVVYRCIGQKRDVVERDEHERTGLRATLNFGHTVGHAIEQVTNYAEFLHGEAISIGMVVETRLAEVVGMAEKGTADFVQESLAKQGLPTSTPLLRGSEQLLAAMRRDKKASRKGMAFSLLTRIGQCKLVEDVSEKDVKAALQIS